MESCVLELGTWRVRSGPAGDDSPVLDPADGVVAEEKLWNVDGLVDVVKRRKGTASSLLVVETSEWMDSAVRARVLSGLLEGVEELERVYFLRAAAAAVFAVGRTSGVVVDIGEAATVVSAAVEGHLLRKSVRKNRNAGAELSKLLQPLLPDGTDIHAAKAKLFAAVPSEETPATYILPDGKTIQVPAQKITELSSFVTNPIAAVTSAVVESVDPDAKKVLQNTEMVVIGGTSLVCTVLDAVQQTSSTLGMQTLIAPGSDRTVQTWRGGSILASLPSFPQMAITRAELAEHGEKIFSLKCP